MTDYPEQKSFELVTRSIQTLSLIFTGWVFAVSWLSTIKSIKFNWTFIASEKADQVITFKHLLSRTITTTTTLFYIPRLKKIIWVIGVLRRTVVIDWRFDNLCGSHLQSQVVVLVSWKFKNPGERFGRFGRFWSVDRVAVGKCVMWLAVKTCAEMGYANRWVVAELRSPFLLARLCSVSCVVKFLPVSPM